MFTTGETARLLGVTPQTVINWMESGRLPFARIGTGRRRVDAAVLRRFVLRNAIPTADLDPALWERIQSQPIAPPLTDSTGTLAMFSATLAGQITGWSLGARDLLGWSPQEMMGQNLSSVMARVPGMPVDLTDLAVPPEDGQAISLRLELGHLSGAFITTDVTLTWIQDARKKLVGTVFHLETPQAAPEIIPIPVRRRKSRNNKRPYDEYA